MRKQQVGSINGCASRFRELKKTSDRFSQCNRLVRRDGGLHRICSGHGQATEGGKNAGHLVERRAAFWTGFTTGTDDVRVNGANEDRGGLLRRIERFFRKVLLQPIKA